MTEREKNEIKSVSKYSLKEKILLNFFMKTFNEKIEKKEIECNPADDLFQVAIAFITYEMIGIEIFDEKDFETLSFLFDEPFKKAIENYEKIRR